MTEETTSEENARLAAGWRILIFIGIFVVLSGVLSLVAVALEVVNPEDMSLPTAVLAALIGTVAVLIARKYLDKKSFVSLGMVWDRKAVFDIIAGFLNGGLVMGLMFVVMLAAGLIEFTGLVWWQEGASAATGFQWSVMTAILAALVVTALTGWWEELAFRGYLFQNIREGLGLWWAVAISSLLFGFVHYGNPNATVLSSLLISFLIVPFIYAYLKTGQLWFAMGLHMGWNFFQTTLFGFQTSGTTGVSLITHTPNGPDWLTGGSFGAEGSVLIVPIGAVVLIYVHYWNKWNRHPNQKFMETEL
ncbi:MAG: hypothetical protein COB37_02810 [Kordiimonadales bacterium]|nr:MAG: hypothetical protein COB37_02810 [Kordiimonadales bacterium]